MATGRGRDLAGDGGPNGHPVPPQPGGLRFHLPPAQGLRGGHALSGDGPDRHLPRPGPPAVLRLLRGDPGPHVPDNRGVGRGASGLRGRQVLHLHRLRFGAAAGGDHRPGCHARLPDTRRPAQLRLPGTAGPGHLPDRPDVAVRRVCPGLCDQGAPVSLPHLASRRPRGSAHGRVGAAGRSAPEARYIRAAAVQPHALSRGDGLPGAGPGGPGGGGDHLRGGGGDRPARPQEAGRLFVGQPPGVRGAGDLRPHFGRAPGSGHPERQPRAHHRGAVPAGRDAL